VCKKSFKGAERSRESTARTSISLAEVRPKRNHMTGNGILLLGPPHPPQSPKKKEKKGGPPPVIGGEHKNTVLSEGEQKYCLFWFLWAMHNCILIKPFGLPGLKATGDVWRNCA